ncbi:hypothetical protein BUN20_20350 [Bacteroides fragilis]|mgnify:CR=1 FL=1|nr:hypothetical protein BUN20_20350 [Bacteroides fragilis]EFR54129.1 hypothetical protein BFAG_02827 [Bacteroides fragilis 3_1_12]OCL17262.1 hypothetical protein AOQ65_12000 [Bacteroides fragilis]OCM96780.1 hypothetical protein AE749_13560 [Bacteroides fragilis]
MLPLDLLLEKLRGYVLVKRGQNMEPSVGIMITFGHIFRESPNVSYRVNHADIIFNQLYLIELLYPENKKIECFHIIKSRYNEEKFNQAINELGKLKDEIIALKQYY